MSRLEVITGPMFSGKSEEMIRRLRRFQYAHMSILVVKPKTDTRQADEIATKLLNDQTGEFEKADKFPALNIDNREELANVIISNNYDVLAIDEGQFFDSWLVEMISHLLHPTDKYLQIFVSGLDMDAWRRPFGIMPQLMAMADHIYKTKAVCFACGADALFTQKIGGSGQQIEVGSGKIYEARCRKCHTLPA